jgi:ATP-dependent DNA helicase DinG
MAKELDKLISDAFEESLPDCLGESFERRRGQLEMALAVGASAAQKRIAVIEAETGLGKSLAYLVPILICCSREGKRAVISTYTRTLQRQLIEKDFLQALRATRTTVEGAVLMGRANYACKKAVESVMKADAPAGGETGALLKTILMDPEGDLESIPGIGALRQTAGDSLACPPRDTVCRRCSMREECFLLLARRRALSADIVFVNHALLFSNVQSGGMLLGPFDFLVIDEAHHLQEAATSFLTLTFSPESLRGTNCSLYSNDHDELFAYARAMALKENPEKSDEIEVLWQRCNDQLLAAHGFAEELFRALGTACCKAFGGATRESYGENWVYTEGSPLFYGAEDHIEGVKNAMLSVSTLVEGMMEMFGGDFEESIESPQAVLLSFKNAVRETYGVFDLLVSGKDEDYVFSIKTGTGGEASALVASPIDVSAQLGAYLEEGAESVVMTSATLAVNGDFSYTLDSTGLTSSRRVDTHLFASPFDLQSQRKLLLATFLPDPSEGEFLSGVGEVVETLSEGVSKRMLVLCTSRRQVHVLLETLSRNSKMEMLLLPHICGSSRRELSAEFRAGPGKILLGLASFWEGIDLPGDLLEIVVIVKMPFMVPSEPLVRARAEKLRRHGENPFRKLFLPDAVLKLKQGSGRLIRTSSDRGVVIVLDSRLGEKEYGDEVLQALTGNCEYCKNMGELLAQVKAAFM